jgi:hypothetical protein
VWWVWTRELRALAQQKKLDEFISDLIATNQHVVPIDDESPEYEIHSEFGVFRRRSERPPQ